MADTKISLATLTTPASTDLIPIERPASAVARYSTVGAVVSAGNYDAAFYVDDPTYGAVGDDVADDTAAIQAAITAATHAVNSDSPVQVRHGRIHVVFDPSKTYKITSALDLCNVEGFTLDGGAAGRGAVIHGVCTGAMLEVIGSGEGVIKNIEFVGDSGTKPTCAIWIGRSGATHGTNSTNINFYDCTFSGYFTKCGVYSLDSEDNHFYNCKWFLKGGGATGCMTIARTNIYTLTPEHTTLLGGDYGPYNISFENCHFYADGGDPIRPVYAHESGFNARKCYFYTTGKPAIEVVGYNTAYIVLDDCLVEGTITRTIQLTYLLGSQNQFQFDIRAMAWGTPTTGYMIYADDNTTVQDSRITTSPPLGDTTARNIRVYDAYNVDFSGVSGWSSNAANAITVAHYSAACKFRLIGNESYTAVGDYGNKVEYYGVTQSEAIVYSAAATTLGSVTKKIEIFNASGASLGFIAVYDAIT